MESAPCSPVQCIRLANLLAVCATRDRPTGVDWIDPESTDEGVSGPRSDRAPVYAWLACIPPDSGIATPHPGIACRNFSTVARTSPARTAGAGAGSMQRTGAGLQGACGLRGTCRSGVLEPLVPPCDSRARAGVVGRLWQLPRAPQPDAPPGGAAARRAAARGGVAGVRCVLRAGEGAGVISCCCCCGRAADRAGRGGVFRRIFSWNTPRSLTRACSACAARSACTERRPGNEPDESWRDASAEKRPCAACPMDSRCAAIRCASRALCSVDPPIGVETSGVVGRSARVPDAWGCALLVRTGVRAAAGDAGARPVRIGVRAAAGDGGPPLVRIGVRAAAGDGDPPRLTLPPPKAALLLRPPVGALLDVTGPSASSSRASRCSDSSCGDLAFPLSRACVTAGCTAAAGRCAACG